MIFREDGVNGTAGITQIGSHHAGPVIGGCNMGDQAEGALGNAAGLYGAATGANPSVRAIGDDANITLDLQGKGTGSVSMTANGQQRFIANPVSKTIVDGSATSLFDVACAASAMVGGQLDYLIEASDGTDFQAQAGTVQYAAVNKAGTHTTSIVEDSTAFASALSSGTLTRAWTLVTGTNKVTAKLQPTGSLTETTFRITYTVRPIKGAVTIL